MIYLVLAKDGHCLGMFRCKDIAEFVRRRHVGSQILTVIEDEKTA